MEQDKKYKVSVVTAVYNVEAYLGEMIESIIAQTIGFENIQLILVDDGSMDRSGEICDQYARQYADNIVVVHKENGGVSSARNEGLKRVKGEYVNFTDADDMLEDNALQLMYEYLKKNEEMIDLVAIRSQFFGARSGEHPLNYRFGEGSRIVDLREEYDSIHLAINSILAKKDCFDSREFEGGLAYAEDARLIIDILLDKMQYGIIDETSYMYRKRETGDSAIDFGRDRSAYYIPYLEKFILFTLKNAQNKKGYLPRFVQYTCMYDLQWRLNKKPLVNVGVLDIDEEKKYKELLLKAVQSIDNEIIIEQKNIASDIKMAILLLKEENKNKKEFVFSPNDVRVCIGDTFSVSMGDYSTVLEFIDISRQKIVIDGYVRVMEDFKEAEIIFAVKRGDCILDEYPAELFKREEKDTFFMDEIITMAKGFRCSIARKDMYGSIEVQIYVRYHGINTLCKNVLFGKFFPLTNQMECSYFYRNGILLTYYNSMLHLSEMANKRVKRYEKRFQKEMLSKKDKMIFRGWIARNLYHFFKLLKRKELWLISDRLTKADDNGEAFFTYMNTIGMRKDIDTYFVLDKDSNDYERLRKIGKVVPFHSMKHKVLSLLCDKVVSSQGDDYVFNRFFGLSYLYKDILYTKKFVFLQHGIIKDDLSRWLAKANKNISLFVTATNAEYQSVLDNAYYYDKEQVKCTGLPRYDYLYDNAEGNNVITFMPTWRSYLAGNMSVETDSRVLKVGFESSAYCRMYQQVFTSRKLQEAAQQYHYDIQLMLHPTMPRECIEYFKCGNVIKILDRDVRYRQLYAESKLVITDYSSAVFDFAYLRKPVIYYQQDAEEFFSGKHTYDRGYYNYEKDGFGEVEYTAEALVSRIVEYMQNGCQLKDIYRDRIEKTFPYNDRNNCKRVYEEIMKL